MNTTLIVGIIVFAGFSFGKLADRIALPRVTGYVLAGILLNPNLFGIISKDFTTHTSLITNIALCFITFSVGGTIFWPKLKSLGKSILLITVFEAEFAFLFVALGFVTITPFALDVPNATWLGTIVPVSILIGALAAPTDPSATLAVVHEYHAEGPVSSTIMGVAALDDALGIMNYSLVIAFASVAVSHSGFSLNASLGKPALLIAASITLGTAFGVLFNATITLVTKDTEGTLIVVITGLLALCFGVATWLGLDELMATMVMGIVVCNANQKRERIFTILERYVEELIFVLFFTLSAMQLEFSVLFTSYGLVLAFVLLRTVGKVSGTVLGSTLSKAPTMVRRYAAAGFIPQGGIVIGLALMIKQHPDFSGIADLVISVIIGTAVIHELIGPALSKLALRRAGELRE